MTGDLLVVAHSVIPYLPKSGSWIYAQLRALSRYRPIVVTKRVENLQSFPFAPIYSRCQLSPLNQLESGPENPCLIWLVMSPGT